PDEARAPPEVEDREMRTLDDGDDACQETRYSARGRRPITAQSGELIEDLQSRVQISEHTREKDRGGTCEIRAAASQVPTQRQAQSEGKAEGAGTQCAVQGRLSQVEGNLGHDAGQLDRQCDEH